MRGTFKKLTEKGNRKNTVWRGEIAHSYAWGPRRGIFGEDGPCVKEISTLVDLNDIPRKLLWRAHFSLFLKQSRHIWRSICLHQCFEWLRIPRGLDEVIFVEKFGRNDPWGLRKAILFIRCSFPAQVASLFVLFSFLFAIYFTVCLLLL